jgi:hypothetical protein
MKKQLIFHNSEDKIDLDHIQIVEIKDYIYMRKNHMPTEIKWRSIRSMCITKFGMTLWQISENYLNSLNARAIGQFESSVHLFEWILKNNK